MIAAGSRGARMITACHVTATRACLFDLFYSKSDPNGDRQSVQATSQKPQWAYICQLHPGYKCTGYTCTDRL